MDCKLSMRDIWYQYSFDLLSQLDGFEAAILHLDEQLLTIDFRTNYH